MEKQTGRLTRVKGRKGDMPVHGTENKHEIQADKAIGAEGSNTEDLTSATDPLLQKIPDTWVKDGRTSPSHWARQRQPGWSGRALGTPLRL